jgi:glycosyltransferase involved in cell wall biosynthesis
LKTKVLAFTISQVIKVLLVSPLDPDKPGNLKFLMGGENTYARTLLANPPKGVNYIHHTKALEKGLISYLPIHKMLTYLVKFRILPPSAGTQALLIKSDFDLIHVHAYSIKIASAKKGRKKIPIVMSDSSSNFLFLRDYLHWPSWRINLGLALKRVFFDNLGVIDPDTNFGRASKLVVFSRFAAQVHKNQRIPADKIEVIYPGLPKRKLDGQKRRDYVNIFFAGVWFERKGGAILLEAFKILSKKFSNIKLTILGPVPKKLKIGGLNIFQKDFVPYPALLKQFYPEADIFVLVPPLAEGYGLVVEEAASFGVPAVVSRVYALPEMVDDGVTGFVVEPKSVKDLVEKLEVLIKDEDVRRRFGRAAQDRFNNEFTIEKSNRKLLKVYQEALAT